MVAVYSGSGGSDGGSSSKKVSFNKAVRVKKYTTPPHQRSISPIVCDQPKFWFKVCRPSPSQFSPSSSNSNSNNFHNYYPNFDQSHPQPQPPVQQQLSPTPNTTTTTTTTTNISQHPTPVIRSYSDSESPNNHRSSPPSSLPLSQQKFPSSPVPPPIHPISRTKNFHHNSDSDSTNTSSSSSCGGGSEPVRPPRRRKARPLSTIIDVDSSSVDANDSVIVISENMPRSELSTSSNVRSRNKVDRSDSRRIINYEPYRSPPKDSTILITPETDGYTHEWIPRAASPSMLGKSALISDEDNDNNNNKINSSSLGNGNVDKIVRQTSPTVGSGKSAYKSSSPMDYDMEDSRTSDKKSSDNNMMVIPKEDDNEIIIRKETKKPTKFKVMWGAKVKKLPMFPPPPPPSMMKSKEDKSGGSKTSNKVINYENDPTYMEDTIEDRDRPCMDEKKAQKKIIENYQASSPEMKARRLEPTDLTRPVSPTRSPIRSETFVVTRNSPTKDGMSKSMIEKSGDRGVERYDDTVLVEKLSPTTIERSRDIRSDMPLSNRMEPVATWESGPMLISDQRDKQSSSNYVPGEGRTETSLEVGSRVWRNKTRRMYEEPIIGKHRAGYQPDRDLSPVGRRSSPPPPPLPSSSLPSGSRMEKPSEEMRYEIKEKEKDDSRKNHQHQREREHHHRPRTDDDKPMITGDKLDELFLQKEEAPMLGNEPDFFPFLDSYNPPMEDKACQCNLKKSSKSLRNRSPPTANITDDEHGSILTNTGYRVIKSGRDGSVSAYSNVPSLDDHEDNRERRAVFDDNQRIVFHHPERSDVIYSQVDKSKKRSPNETQGPRHVQRDVQNLSEDYDDYVYEANPVRDLRSEQGSRGPTKRRSSPSPVSTNRYNEGLRPPSRSSSISPNKTITSTTKNYGFSMKTAADSPVVKLPSKPPGSFDGMSNGTLTKKGRAEANKRQTIEESMSISDVSSDVTRPSANRHHRQHHHQHHHQTVNATDSEDMAPPKSNFKELNHHQRRNEMSYEDGSPTHRRMVGRKAIPYDGQSINSNTSWYKSLDEDYRKSANEPANINRAKDSYTLSRVHDRRDLKRDYSPMSARNAYTLDRRYMDQRKRNKRSYLTNDGTDSQLGIRSDLDMGHERVLPNSMRKYSSNRDLHSDLDVSPARGGLAAAYRARQKRASSLNRYAESDLMYPASRVHHVPVYHGSQSQLNRLHPAHSAMPDNLERMSRSYQGGSRTRLYQNEPISLYIPAVKESSRDHSGKRTSDDERGSKIGIGRTQSILSLSRGSKLGIMKKPATKGNSNTSLNEITSKLNGYLNTGPSGLHDEDEIVALREGDENVKSKKKSLKRSQSIPKDAKLPWFQKLKMKVKS